MRHSNHLLDLGTAWLLATTMCASAAGFSDWSQRQRFDVPAAGLLKVSLPAATLDAARPDLADLRLGNGQGAEIPFLIEHVRPGAKAMSPPRSFKLELGPTNTTLAIETGLDRTLAALHLTTPATGFIKAAAVSGSADGTHWRPLTAGQPLFAQVGGASQLRIELPAGAWRFLRVTVDDRSSAPVPFVGAELELAAAEPGATESAPVRLVERTESPGETRLTLDLGGAGLRLATLQFGARDPLFRRQVTLAVREVDDGVLRERTLATGSIYRVAVPGQPASEHLSLDLDLPVPGRELVVRIQNEDSPPLDIPSLQARRWPVHLVFLATQAGEHQLLTGNPQCPPARYDLGRQGLDIQSARDLDVALGPVEPNPGYLKPDTLPEVQEVGAEIDVEAWAYRKAVILEQPGAQQLELDLEVLAHAQPGVADLRLVRSGRQHPYILERTSVVRALPVAAVSANDPDRPRVSVWTLKLPHAGLPLTRLTCVSGTPLFRRSVGLHEMASDDRGARYRRELASATWTQSPDRNSRAQVLVFGAAPMTDTLTLEIENEDNPAIALEGFECGWLATRMLFKATTVDRLDLYYGNPQANSPRYDLSLVANQLLRAEKAKAALGPEETLRAAGWAQGRAAGQGKWIFWGVLGLVVVALLAVIARLVPRETQSAP